MASRNSQEKIKISTPNHQGRALDSSSLDKLLGKHTNSVLVAVMFTTTLIAFLAYVFVGKLSPSITTGFIGLLSTLAGYFVASLKSKN
jgi:hypothetical protein